MIDQPMLGGDDDEARRASRRDALKKIGMGAGVAWSAPVAIGLFNQANAGGTPPPSSTSSTTSTTLPNPCTCDGDPCFCQTDCNTVGCLCNQNVTNGVPNGSTFCTEPTDCTNQVCQNDSDCPSGQVCQATCCDVPRCFVLCDPSQGRAAAAPAGGWASAPHR